MIYTKQSLNEISFPIGGIGSGSFGIAGNGRFVDWEILNKPAKGKILGFSHIAVRAKFKDGKTVAKILNGDITKDLTGTYGRAAFQGFGFGPQTGTMAGLPHFKNLEFNGEFPVATLTFKDDDFPGRIELTVFNPLIPLDSKNSSLPAGFFDIKFINDTDEEIEYSAFLSISNPFSQSVNEIVACNGRNMLKLTTTIDKEDIKYGDMCIASDCDETYIQQYWYRGTWNDGIDVYSNELVSGENLKNRVYDKEGEGDTATMQSAVNVSKGENKSVKFVLTWNVPNNYNYWSGDEEKAGKKWKNYYATIFESSVESGDYCLQNFDNLYERTLAFKNALFDTSIDKTVIEAISSTMSVLKTATVLRLEDGSFYGWEGMKELEGSCEGTCQHVWNYAYALCFLFPELEMSIRNNEFTHCTAEDGKTSFRILLPKGDKKWDMRACLDGQMGIIFKTYREWKISGDTEWLKSVWEKVKLILAYAWSEENPDKWDLDKDGVLEGRQHHTLDMELFGPSSWLESMYLCALKAAQEMAEFLGDDEAAEEYKAVFESGYEWSKNNLFNGEYFIQATDLNDTSYTEKFDCPEYLYEEKNELKYQIGEGCAIDQMLGQWHADILALGDVLDKSQVQISLKNLYKYNFKSMRDVLNTWRIFAINDEKGAIMCTYPRKRPSIPLPYHAEVMTGFEYALAGLMIAEGMEDEGLELVRAVRDRYNGIKRNPWNEIECGSNYARAMASYSLIPIYSGFKFDLPNKMIGFDPIHKENFKSFFSIGTAWGTVSWEKEKISVKVSEGYLQLNKFFVKADVKRVFADGKELEFSYENGILSFPETKIETEILLCQ